MLTKLKIGTLTLVATAMLALAPTAMAKGGGGDGRATCATIDSFSATLGDTGIALDYAITNGCVDERMSAAAVDYVNETTGFKGRSVTMLSYGLNTFSRVAPTLPGQRYTITLTVYAPNGKIAGTRTATITVPAA